MTHEVGVDSLHFIYQLFCVCRTCVHALHGTRSRFDSEEGSYLRLINVCIASTLGSRIIKKKKKDSALKKRYCLSLKDALKVQALQSRVVQGYLAHKTPPTPLAPPQDPMHRPTVGSYGVAVSYKRGTPYGASRDAPTPGEHSSYSCRFRGRPSHVSSPDGCLDIALHVHDTGAPHSQGAFPAVLRQAGETVSPLLIFIEVWSF